MRIAVGSAHRNMGPRAALYMERVARLRDALPITDRLRVIAVEGDSVDNTLDVLTMAANYHGLNLDLRTCNHGGPRFGSTEEEARMKALSKVGNAIFDGVRDDDDVLVYIESDLVWDAKTITALIADALARRGGFDVFAPLVMAGSAFYDIWGFRGTDGRRWVPLHPYHPDITNTMMSIRPDNDLVEMSSVGSCLIMQGAVARACRIRNDYCLVGWCEDARLHGYRIAARLDKIVRQL